MNTRTKLSCLVIFSIVTSCKTVSRYAIDEHVIIKTDSSLLGIWKAVEDTDKTNYILIQSPYDIFEHFELWYNLDSTEKRKYFTKEELADTTQTKEIFHKNVADYNEYYDRFIEANGLYYLTYFNRHGKNPRYQQWTAFQSEISGEKFLNVSYRYQENSTDEVISGYFFVHLINRNAAQDTITIAVVADNTLKELNNSKEVRKRVKKNLNNPSFYSDTLHFYKVSNYHLELMKSVKQAN